MLYQCMHLSEPHTHIRIWVYVSHGTPTPPGSPTEYSMDTYSILLRVNFQGLRCMTYTLWLRELLISQIWHFLRLSPKLVQKSFRNISKMFHLWQCVWWLEDYHTVLYVNVWFILGIFVQCISLQMYFYINSWIISLIKTEKYAFADLFNSHLTITNSFGKFAIWLTSFRKN